jgi:hypothetical protein
MIKPRYALNVCNQLVNLLPCKPTNENTFFEISAEVIASAITSKNSNISVKNNNALLILEKEFFAILPKCLNQWSFRIK